VDLKVEEVGYDAFCMSRIEFVPGRAGTETPVFAGRPRCPQLASCERCAGVLCPRSRASVPKRRKLCYCILVKPK
jgi:hypothetical protein